jgi:hypothetical protein
MNDREGNSDTEPNVNHITRGTGVTDAAQIRRRPITPVVVAVAATAAMLTIGIGSPRGVAAGPEAARTAYLPSVSDLMIATIQPRHERLWRAGQDNNWAFASYELGNLRGAFNRIGLAHPTVHDTPFPEMIGSVTEKPLDALNSAIQAKDGEAFARGFVELTDACNSCHQALNHGMVEIRVPSRTSASDLKTDSTPRN